MLLAYVVQVIFENQDACHHSTPIKIDQDTTELWANSKEPCVESQKPGETALPLAKATWSRDESPHSGFF